MFSFFRYFSILFLDCTSFSPFPFDDKFIVLHHSFTLYRSIYSAINEKDFLYCVQLRVLFDYGRVNKRESISRKKDVNE